jgi:hypothetical protein
MRAQKLKDILRRVAGWPEAAQIELAELALEIDAELGIGAFEETPAELNGIDRGLEAARERRFGRILSWIEGSVGSAWPMFFCRPFAIAHG